MNIIKDILTKSNARKNKVTEAVENDLVYSTVEQRKLSHNEREMIARLREEKEECMKEAVYWDNRKRQAMQRLKAQESMKFNPEFFNNDSILKQKNIFLNGGDF